MKSNSLHLVAALVTIAAFSACASPTKKQLNEKVSEENSVQTNNDLNQEAGTVLKSTSRLTEAQKNKLVAIRTDMVTKNEELHKEALKLRSVLIKDIISDKEHLSEINLIKSRLKEIEDKRLQNLFDSIDKANESLGKEASANQKALEETLREDRQGKYEN